MICEVSFIFKDGSGCLRHKRGLKFLPESVPQICVIILSKNTQIQQYHSLNN